MKTTSHDSAEELNEADTDSNGADNQQVVSGNLFNPVDASGVSDVARMITDTTKGAGRDATRVWHFVGPPQVRVPPVGLVPVLEAVDAAALETDLQVIDGFSGVWIEAVLFGELVAQVLGQLGADAASIDVAKSSGSGLDDQDEAEQDGVDQHLGVGSSTQAHAAQDRGDHNDAS